VTVHIKQKLKKGLGYLQAPSFRKKKIVGSNLYRLTENLLTRKAEYHRLVRGASTVF